MPSVTFNNIDDLISYIDNHIKTNGNSEITGEVANNAISSLGTFLKKNPRNWNKADIVTQTNFTYTTTSDHQIIIFSGNATGSLIFNDNAENEWLFINLTSSGISLGNNLTYSDLTGQIKNSIPSNSVVGITKGIDNLWYSNQGSSTGSYNSSVSDSLQTVQLGGISAGTLASTLKGKTYDQLLDQMLFPDTPPTYTIPNILTTLTSGTIGTFEVGISKAISLSLTGIKNDAGDFTRLTIYRNSTILNNSSAPPSSSATSLPSQYGFADPNNPNKSFTITASDTVTVPYGSIQWYGQGDYNAGLPKKNNKGVTDSRTAQVRDSSYPQNSATNYNSNTLTVTGIYPFYWGVSGSQPTSSDIAQAIQNNASYGTVTVAPNKVLADASGTISINFNASGQYLWFAVLGSFTTKTVWYVTALNNGSIGGASNLFGYKITQNFTSPNGYWSNIPFGVYISNFATSSDSGNPTMQLRNS